MSAHTPAELEQLAAGVRRRRTDRGWTLDEAAARLGVSRRLVAQIEAAEANPSLTTLLALAAGFDTSLVDLIAIPNDPTITVQADNDTAPLLWTGPTGGEGRLLVGSDPLELWTWTLQPGEERGSDSHRTDSREALMVLAGTLTLTVGSATATINAGQSAMFRAEAPHSYRNDGTEPTTYVLAVHEPIGGPK